MARSTDYKYMATVTPTPGLSTEMVVFVSAAVSTEQVRDIADALYDVDPELALVVLEAVDEASVFNEAEAMAEAETQAEVGA